jgi:1,4-alpha-glucan branching enzyme
MVRTRWPSLARIAAAAIAACVLSAACAPVLVAPFPESTPAGVRFVFLDSRARTVAVAGSFNEWSPSTHPLRREEPLGRWSVVVALPPGEHQFAYVVDGTRWTMPPAAEAYADDGFGAKNGVVVVRPLEP